ncbi:Gfo/Idh/MocA family protein [Roseateles amylovorans]|jgi:D-xylose 1-dehydrogenase (NADP+, D-xylono-1,5-lactone-forming)|uniref:Gfo/Idh/MocA family oxidoreductase n=1 Tax=Roseateles amylovorans TaxID=2978473 RepID=A0ABY6B6A3_9BURK|nr:Gfo/Idh/MocA family oxidoreductase [Roseateles amylovorans]UXH79084.1 Gfo/Idh/MocA family oxidoreductase [Roseateles amylovorans]
MSPSNPVSFGILGTGLVASAFARESSSSPKVRLTSVASRNMARAEAFASKFGIARATDAYADLLADPDVEAVYIALPNSMHKTWCIRAVEAGKHVLCEKPLTGTAADARAIYDAARANGRQLVEAYPYRAQPQSIELLRLIRSGELGRPVAIQACFGFKLTNPEDIRLSPDLAGGALMDAGAYPISLVRAIAGARPTQVQAFAQRGAQSVDTAVLANLAFADGLMAQIACNFGASSHRFAVIACENGVIEANYSNGTPGNTPLTLRLKRHAADGSPVFETMEFHSVDAFRAEAECFADHLRGVELWSGITEQESVDVAAMLEQIAASASQVG